MGDFEGSTQGRSNPRWLVFNLFLLRARVCACARARARVCLNRKFFCFVVKVVLFVPTNQSSLCSYHMGGIRHKFHDFAELFENQAVKYRDSNSNDRTPSHGVLIFLPVPSILHRCASDSMYDALPSCSSSIRVFSISWDSWP